MDIGDGHMSEVKDYTTGDAETGNTHFQGVPSAYGKSVAEQQKQQPKYCMPGECGDTMKGEKSNKQAGA